MFVPAAFAFTGQAQQLAFIEQYPFAVLTTGDLQATHLPMLVNLQGNSVTLLGHVARGNPHWRALDNTPALAVFSGPHAYISPKWYASEPNVPTWNYVAVHAKGTLQIMTDSELLAAIDELMATFEPDFAQQEAGEAYDVYRQKLLKGIVGITLHVEHLKGVRKLGQHKSQADQAGVSKGLRSTDNYESLALLNYMQRHDIGYANEEID
ncbi:FMN-binding negative transcriptional regulator [Alteromonas gilva]|uniref:FMN-binding negative transcriptional regulator n=1 Tax=Alteromonas gilva TaxID=2987522 RepID=A0ABT5L849_9ALTE|nr:FMN-binding negative transcriptional regulator [Alteromonas gilva]MDC8831983.1 FMN-binding negative transcriptional regulator [Alteromonas gilva]